MNAVTIKPKPKPQTGPKQLTLQELAAVVEAKFASPDFAVRVGENPDPDLHYDRLQVFYKQREHVGFKRVEFHVGGGVLFLFAWEQKWDGGLLLSDEGTFEGAYALTDLELLTMALRTKELYAEWGAKELLPPA